MTSTAKSLGIHNIARHNAGFTIIELMAVVSIVSILAVIAIPVYLDYITRSKVSEGMVFVAEAKTSVTEYYYSTKSIAETNADAGLPNPTKYNSHKYISRLEVTSSPSAGSITVTFKIPGLGADNLLQLVPSISNGLMVWTCSSPAANGIDASKIPPSCRG